MPRGLGREPKASLGRGFDHERPLPFRADSTQHSQLFSVQNGRISCQCVSGPHFLAFPEALEAHDADTERPFLTE